MMLKPVWIVAFSGHRVSDDPAKGPGRSAEEISACRESLRTVFKSMLDDVAKQDGGMEFVAGLAAGSDIEAAEVARELDIPVHVMLPSPEVMFEQDFVGIHAKDWPRAKKLIDEFSGDTEPGFLAVVKKL